MVEKEAKKKNYVHLEMRNLKQKNAKKIEQEGEKKLQEEMKRSSVTEDHEKQRQAILKRLKRGD